LLQRGEGRSHNIVATDPSTGTEQQLTDPGEDATVVAPSPDGDLLAYVTQESPDHWNLIVLRLADHQTRAILSHQSGAVVRLTWSPQGDDLAAEVREVYASTASASHIFVVRTDGSQPDLVYGRNEETGSMPAWSPDGTELAFNDVRRGELMLFNFTSILRTVSMQAPTALTWSPQGDALAFAARPTADAPLTAVQVARLGDGADGEDMSAVPITTGPLDGDPAWSPTGEWIAFTRRTDSTTQEVWLIRPDASDAHALAAVPDQLFAGPIWSPDGAAVAVTRVPGDSTWVVSASGESRYVSDGRVVAWIP
jgi:Tol biopolymer transport system component